MSRARIADQIYDQEIKQINNKSQITTTSLTLMSNGPPEDTSINRRVNLNASGNLQNALNIYDQNHGSDSSNDLNDREISRFRSSVSGIQGG